MKKNTKCTKMRTVQKLIYATNGLLSKKMVFLGDKNLRKKTLAQLVLPLLIVIAEFVCIACDGVFY